MTTGTRPGRTQEYDKTTGSHWNQLGHSVSDMGFTVLEKVFKKDEAYRKHPEDGGTVQRNEQRQRRMKFLTHQL